VNSLNGLEVDVSRRTAAVSQYSTHLGQNSCSSSDSDALTAVASVIGGIDFLRKLVNSYQTVWRHIPQGSNRYFAACSTEVYVGTAVFFCRLYGKKVLESLKLKVDVKKCAKSDVILCRGGCCLHQLLKRSKATHGLYLILGARIRCNCSQHINL
jgi:hypothetical protein